MRNNRGKYGNERVTMNANGFFFFKFSSIQGAEVDWFVRNNRGKYGNERVTRK